MRKTKAAQAASGPSSRGSGRSTSSRSLASRSTRALMDSYQSRSSLRALWRTAGQVSVLKKSLGWAGRMLVVHSGSASAWVVEASATRTSPTGNHDSLRFLYIIDSAFVCRTRRSRAFAVSSTLCRCGMIRCWAGPLTLTLSPNLVAVRWRAVGATKLGERGLLLIVEDGFV